MAVAHTRMHTNATEQYKEMIHEQREISARQRKIETK